jgi:hypothetical protein
MELRWRSVLHGSSSVSRSRKPPDPPPVQSAKKTAAKPLRIASMQASQLVHLVKAAEEAILQWKYKPTLLNGEPVEVITDIFVNFTLTP